MKKMLYWNSGKGSFYYLDERKARREFELVKSFKTLAIRLYRLEVDITDEMLEKLFNKDLNHCEISNYKEAFGALMHLVNSSGSEFNTRVQTGSHQITAIVQLPEKEKPCVLPWAENKLTQLDDILFLLTLFTGRSVFKKDLENEDDVALIQDHRIHHYGAT